MSRRDARLPVRLQMSRRLWPLVLLTAILAVFAMVRTIRAEADRAHRAALQVTEEVATSVP